MKFSCIFDKQAAWAEETIKYIHVGGKHLGWAMPQQILDCMRQRVQIKRNKCILKHTLQVLGDYKRIAQPKCTAETWI